MTTQAHEISVTITFAQSKTAYSIPRTKTDMPSTKDKQKHLCIERNDIRGLGIFLLLVLAGNQSHKRIGEQRTKDPKRDKNLPHLRLSGNKLAMLSFSAPDEASPPPPT